MARYGLPEDDPYAPISCHFCRQDEGSVSKGDGLWLCDDCSDDHDAVEALADALVNLS